MKAKEMLLQTTRERKEELKKDLAKLQPKMDELNEALAELERAEKLIAKLPDDFGEDDE